MAVETAAAAEAAPRAGGFARADRALQGADLSRRVGRVSDLIGLIIEATGVQVEIGEVCMVGEGRDRAQVATEVVGFRGGRTLLMPLGELHGIGPGTSVHPTGRQLHRIGPGTASPPGRSAWPSASRCSAA